MQTSRIKCIHPKEICKALGIVQRNAGKHTACCIAAYVCQNKKENMLRSSSSSPHQNNMIFMLHDYTRLQTSSFYDSFGFYFFFTFCVVIPQRSETVVVCVTCIVHATAMTLRIFLLFIYSLQPAKHKEQLGQQNQTKSN